MPDLRRPNSKASSEPKGLIFISLLVFLKQHLLVEEEIPQVQVAYQGVEGHLEEEEEILQEEEVEILQEEEEVVDLQGVLLVEVAEEGPLAFLVEEVVVEVLLLEGEVEGVLQIFLEEEVVEEEQNLLEEVAVE